jgi:hypothetical protein
MGGDMRRAHAKGRAAAADEDGAEGEEEEGEEEGAEAGFQGADEEDLAEFAPEGVGDKMKRRDFKQMAAVQQQQQRKQQLLQKQQQQQQQQQQQKQQGARANSKEPASKAPGLSPAEAGGYMS